MSLTTTPGTPYTWASASWAWDDGRAGKTWATAYPVVFTEDDDESLTAAEARASAPTVTDAEAFSLDELGARSATASKAEALSLADALFSSVAYLKAMAESFATAEALRHDLDHPTGEPIALEDQRLSSFSRDSAEAIALAEAIRNSKIFVVLAAESFGLTELAAKIIGRDGPEGFGIEDARSFQFTTLFDEALALSETYIDLIAYIVSVYEFTTVGEVAAKFAERGDTESFAASDSHARDIGVRDAEGISISDAIFSSASFLKVMAETVDLAELLSKRPAKASAEAATLADASVRGIGSNATEPTPVVEAKQTNLAVANAEAFSAEDASSRGAGKVSPEAVALGEAARRAVTVSRAETVSVADAAASFLQILNRIAESVALVEALSSQSVQSLPELLALLDARESGFTVPVGEALGVADARASAVTRRDVDNIEASDAYADIIGYVVNVAEALVTAEARLSRTEKAIAEMFGLSDLAGRIVAYLRDEAEALAGTDERRSDVLASFGELIEPVEQSIPVAAFDRRFDEEAALSESYVDLIGFIVSAIEGIGLSEDRTGAVGQNRSEGLPITEAQAKTLLKPLLEAFATSESYVDLIGFISAASESISLAEARRGTMIKRVSEPLPVIERLVRRINAVIADLAIRESGLTQAQFATMLANRRPLAHYPPKALLPGDYRYQRAILRLLLEDRARTTREVALPEATLFVDVPDVTDRGTAVLTSSGLSILFERVFYDPPEVQVMQTGGSTRAIPSVTTITETGFFVQLFDAASPTTPVAGTISWTALGK